MLVPFRQQLGEMMRQRDRTLKLIKTVESLVEGDKCHLARTMNEGNIKPDKIMASPKMPFCHARRSCAVLTEPFRC